MAKGVFLHRPDSIYDDWPEQQYQFPKQYLSRASQFVNDWILYYEPRRGGGRGYFAVARVERIVPDPTIQGMYLAIIEPGSYLPFEQNVPFSDQDGLPERGLLNESGKISGRAQAAVRPISIEDFDRILVRGIPDQEPVLPRISESPVDLSNRLLEEQGAFIADRERIAHLSSRIIRDRVFRTIVLNAYDCRCAVTNLRFINGGGRAEVQAAHIRPVEKSGPDTITNGIALSGTAHWMFDRGLITLSDQFEIMVSRHVNDVDSVRSLVNRTGVATVPADPTLRPHPRFLEWHREHCFKQ